jgi:hypothetical protein
VDEEGARQAAKRLLQAFEMADAGIAMMRETLRRRFPSADEAELDRRLGEWLRHRPGAEHGDAEGKRVSWPR